MTTIVSIIAPCRNEAGHVDAFCADAMAQQLPPGWELELCIADGSSDDGTRERLQSLGAADPRLRCIDNPARIVSAGLNRALAAARGEVVVRMDIHTRYADDYVAQCLAVLAQTGADNVGGPWLAQTAPGATAMARAVVAAFQSPWVAGGAASRRAGHEGWVDTVYLGAWPCATFERFGNFDETLVRNQDDEHNLRIVRGGGRIWQSPRIRSVYQARERLGQVFRQYLQYGYWKPFVMRKHGQFASLRHLVPAVFVIALVAGTLAAVAGLAWPLVALAGTYLLVDLALSLQVAISARLGPAVALRVPAVVATYHLAYSLGSLAGWADVLRRRRGSDRFSTLSR